MKINLAHHLVGTQNCEVDGTLRTLVILAFVAQTEYMGHLFDNHCQSKDISF
jgi:hypothetical protein